MWSQEDEAYVANLLEFFLSLTISLALVGIVLLIAAAFYFRKKEQQPALAYAG